MSQTYGPYALTAGTRQQIAVSGQPGSIRISNQSTSLDLLVSFKTVPPAGTVAGGDWDLVVHAGWAESVPLMKDAQTPYALGAAWQGYLWVMPVSNAAQLAQSGTVPSLANCWVTTYAPGEPVQTGNPGPLGTSSVSQQRVIALAPDPWQNGVFGWNVVATDYKVCTVSYPGPPGSGGYQFWRLYSVRLSGFSSTAVAMTWQIVLQNETAGGVAVGGATAIYQHTMAYPANGVASHVDNLALPVGARLLQPATAAQVSCYLHRVSGTGGEPSTSGVVQLDVVTSATRPDAIPTPLGGQGGLATLQSSTVF